MKRDYIHEINQVKSRSTFLSHFLFDLRSIQRDVFMIEKMAESGATIAYMDLMKIVPISIVACFEGFFKAMCTELIDHGKPFTDNIKEFNKRDIKFDFEIVNAIQSKKISMGEFVSHILSLKNIESINSVLSVLLNTDFLKLLIEFERKSIHDEVNKQQKNFNENHHRIIKSVTRTYEIRNIFCHEYGAQTDFTVEEMKRLYRDCNFFFDHVKYVVGEKMYPNSPRNTG